MVRKNVKLIRTFSLFLFEALTYYPTEFDS